MKKQNEEKNLRVWVMVSKNEISSNVRYCYNVSLVDINLANSIEKEYKRANKIAFFKAKRYLFNIYANQKVFSKLPLNSRSWVTNKRIKYKIKSEKLLDMLLSDNEQVKKMAKTILKNSLINSKEL